MFLSIEKPTSRFVFLEKPVVCGIRQILRDDFAAVQLKGRACVFETKYEKAFETDVTKRALMSFQKHGIRTPERQRRSSRSLKAGGK